MNTSSASCGMRGSFLSASIRKFPISSDGALTMPSKIEACMGSSQPSPSISLTLSPHRGFRKRIDHLESEYSAPFVLCPRASLRDHVPPTKMTLRSTLSILLGIEPMPTIRSPHSRLSPITNIRGLNKKRCKNFNRNNCRSVLEPVSNSNVSATFLSSIKSANLSDRNPSCEKIETAASTSVCSSNAIPPILKRPKA